MIVRRHGAVARAHPVRGAGRRPLMDPMAWPAVFVLGLVIAYPAVQALVLGFYHYKLTESGARWIGITNYQLLAQDPLLSTAIRTTLVFAGVSVVVGCVAGLLLALLTERIAERLPVLQTVLLSPWAVPVIVIAFLFRFIFEQNGGAANALLLNLHLVHTPLPWLSTGSLALLVLVVVNVWSQMPFFLLVFLASLRGVPEPIIEAAKVDGATELGIARHIKIPQVMGAIVPAVLVGVITNFNNFALVWSLTEGGPAYDTTTLVVYVYRLAFTEFNVGYASAVGTIWLVLLVVFAVLFVRMTLGRERTA